MKTVLLLLSPGFEELEAVAPLDLLRRAGIEVVSASTTPELWVEGSHGIRIQADATLDASLLQDYDMIVVPGGPGVDGLRKDPRVLELLRRNHSLGKPLAAICAAPLVLLDAGLIQGRVMTSFPGSQEELEPSLKEYSQDRVVVDGPFITSRGAGSSEEFALAIIAELLGRDAAEDVRRRIVAR